MTQRNTPERARMLRSRRLEQLNRIVLRDPDTKQQRWPNHVPAGQEVFYGFSWRNFSGKFYVCPSRANYRREMAQKRKMEIQ